MQKQKLVGKEKLQKQKQNNMGNFDTHKWFKKQYLEEANINEDIGLKIGTRYDVRDAGDLEFRDGMEYLGYSRNENAHMFRGFGAPGSNDIDIMYVEKGDEEGNIR
tara:strand:- start:54 stop:371 length:318 start_codon:yes stop_codon:yes gene_type:complete